jgi:hypothetical protein
MSKFRATALALLVLAVGALSACGQPGAGYIKRLLCKTKK